MTEQNCPLRKWLKNNSVFHISVNETVLVPTTNDAEKIGNAIIEMWQICRECHNRTLNQIVQQRVKQRG